MKSRVSLRIKIVLIVAPVVLLAFVTYAYWVMQTERSLVLERALKSMSFISEDFVEDHLTARHQLLERSGLSGIPSYVERYQDEAFASISAQIDKIGGEVLLLDQTGKVTHKNVANADDRFAQPLAALLAQVKVNANETVCSPPESAGAEHFLYCSTFFVPWQVRAVYLVERDSLFQTFSYSRNLIFLFAVGVALAAATLLSLSINRLVVSRLRGLYSGMERVRQGELTYRTALTANDEIGALERAFNAMTNDLQANEQKAKVEIWIKSGLAQLDTEMRGGLSLDTLSLHSLCCLARHVESPVGALYVNDGSDTFKLAAGYSLVQEPSATTEFALGQGLVGQAAYERRHLEFTELPEHYLKVASSLGSTGPSALLVVPLLYNDIVFGVLELAAFTPFSEAKKAFLLQAATPLATAISGAKASQSLQKALEKTQRFAEEMQAQQEELQAANEELEKRARSLKDRRSELEE